MRSPITHCVLGIIATLGVAMAQGPHQAGSTPIRQINVVARKFQFEPAALVVSEGEVVRLTIHSDDVVHGFAIPGMNIDVRIPDGGEAVTIEFIAPAPGQYEIVCSKLCGHGHAAMKAMLISRTNDSSRMHTQ